MATSNLIPRSAPFGDDEIVSLERVLGPASPVQRAWLAGFLAGLDAGGGTAAQPSPAVVPRAAEPLTVLFASESGNGERLAGDIAKAARKAGFKPKVVDFADLVVADLAGAGRLVAIAATWGEGEPPGRAARAYGELMGPGAPRLDGVAFGVLALGDTSYAEFCAIGKALDARLEELGGRREIERVDLDLDYEAPAAAWIGRALKALAPPEARADNVVALDFSARTAAEPSRDPVVAEVSEHVNLSSSRSDKQVIHLGLAFEGAAPAYEPGDALDLYPVNDPALVRSVLGAVGLGQEDDLADRVARERDVTTLSVATLEKFIAATGHAGAKALLAEGARAWTEGRQLVDLLDAFPATLSSEQLLAITRPLPPRAYSIASSRKEVGEEAHLLVAATRYETHGRPRSGVASTYVADRLRAGDGVRVRLKANRHFRLPADPATDMLMVGPGTGVAPFRAFVQERRAVGASGRSWLFFGDRRFLHDFTYQLEWQEALHDRSLTRIDVAFSRDAPAKVYVQDRLWAQRRDVVDWLEGGARFYVCGDAKAMAKDVRATLVRAYADVRALAPEAAEAAVAGLERDGRYLQDVY